jgi:modulator of FtsH protease HflC
MERRKIEAEAKAKKQTIEGAADVEADRLRNEAHSKDPEFYAFLQRLKSVQAMLADTRDVLLLSLNHDLFKLLKEPPKEKP